MAVRRTRNTFLVFFLLGLSVMVFSHYLLHRSLIRRGKMSIKDVLLRRSLDDTITHEQALTGVEHSHVIGLIANYESAKESSIVTRSLSTLLSAKATQNSSMKATGSSQTAPPTKVLDCPPLHFVSPPLSQVIVLASCPGSGNTWLRHLLQEATRKYTGSIYLDEDLMRQGFLGEQVTNGSVLLVKTHKWPTKHRRYDKVVLLIRDPSDAYVAEQNRLHGGHTGMAPDSLYRDHRKWSALLKFRSVMWRGFNEAWLRINGTVHVVLYDELKRDVRFHLASLLAFLDFPLKYIECAMQQSEGSFHRKRKAVDISTLVTDYGTKRIIEDNKWQLYEAVYAHRRLFPPRRHIPHSRHLRLESRQVPLL